LNNAIFLGVESSATGRAWRSRLDERGSARALAIAQRHDLPELLARILAGRNVEVGAVKHAFNNQPYFLQMPLPFHLQTRNGAFCDARLATVEIGRDIVETAIERTLEFIDGFIKG